MGNYWERGYNSVIPRTEVEPQQAGKTNGKEPVQLIPSVNRIHSHFKQTDMEIIGRVTKDAEVKNLTDGRKVVAFSVAINDYYKTKSGEKKEEATYFQCSCWLSEKAAERLRKGNIVSLFCRVGLNAYKRMDGEFHANLTFHVNALKVIATTKKGASVETTAVSAETTRDDLPF